MTITSLNIADGTVGRTRLTKKKKLLGVLILLAALVVIAVIVAITIISRHDDDKDKVPEPNEQLPPSASVLRVFKKAAVCADAAPCAEIGMKTLQKGGSAIDATIATMLCNGVFAMQSMGLGGGFLMTIYKKDENRAYALDARETAPKNATPGLYVNDQLSKTGPLAIAVPGELKGYKEAHQKFGKLPWKDVVEPVVHFCNSGYNMSKHQHDSMALNIVPPKSHVDSNDTNFREWFFTSNFTLKPEGSKIVPTKLCQTLQLISDEGPDTLYTGSLSVKLLEDLKSIGSILTAEDLQSYQAKWRDPITTTFKNGAKLFSVPPPGSGALLAFIMNILDGYSFTPESLEGVENTVQTYHRMIEAFKYAYAQRTQLGDIDFINIDNLIKNLSSVEFANEIRNKIRDNFTSSDPKYYGAVSVSNDDHGTAHISVVSEDGDAVSVTSSVNIYYGNGMTSRQTGIIFNSVMDDFSFPQFKNYFGLPASPNNIMKPGKRPLSSMSPTIIVDKNNDVELVIGASGGTKITTTIAEVSSRILWMGETVKEAIDAPRIHNQIFPMSVSYEHGVLKQELDGLSKIGHKLEKSKPGSIICALYKHNATIYSNADYRKGGDVYGF